MDEQLEHGFVTGIFVLDHATQKMSTEEAERLFGEVSKENFWRMWPGIKSWAEDLWHRAHARFDTWIDGAMTELRAGLQSAPDDDVRPITAPGGEWVRYVPPRFDDD